MAIYKYPMDTSIPHYSILHNSSNELLLYFNRPDNNWEGPDNEEFYNTSLKSQPNDWEYRNKTVRYNWNSNGYRAPEWKDVDWSNSILVLGCSLVAGVGLSEDDCIANQMSQTLGFPVVNLGIPAGAIDALYYNSLKLIDLKIKPKAVCVLMPGLSRVTYFTAESKNLGPWYPTMPGADKFYGIFYKHWAERIPNAEVHSILMTKGIEASWRAHGVPFNIWHPNELSPYVDHARDLAHPGSNTAANWASTMSDWVDTVVKKP